MYARQRDMNIDNKMYKWPVKGLVKQNNVVTYPKENGIIRIVVPTNKRKREE